MTETQINARLTALERKVNELQVVITNLATMAQLRQLNVIKQAEIDSLKKHVADLESAIQILQTQS